MEYENTNTYCKKHPPPHHIEFTHHLSFRNINLNANHHNAGKGFIHGPKHNQGNQFSSLKHFRWLSGVKFDIKEVHGN